MSKVEIFEGGNGWQGLTDKLIELGAFTNVLDEVDEETLERIRTVYVNDKIGFRGTMGREDNATSFSRWVDMMNFEANYLLPLYLLASVKDVTNHTWKIIKIDDTFLFGLAKYTNEAPAVQTIIGNVVDSNGDIKRGILSVPRENATSNIAIVTENVTQDDMQYAYKYTSPYATLLSKIHCTTCKDKFVNIYKVEASPYDTTRKMTVDGKFFYIGDTYSKLAVEVESFD